MNVHYSGYLPVPGSAVYSLLISILIMPYPVAKMKRNRLPKE